MKLPLSRRGALASILASAMVAACLLAVPGAHAAATVPRSHVSGNALVDQNGHQAAPSPVSNQDYASM